MGDEILTARGRARPDGAGTWEVPQSPTAAPTVGRVLPGVRSRLAPGVVHHRSTTSLDSLFAGEFHVAAASLAGSAHLANGTPRQDDYGFACTETGRLVIAVADGMGSREHSQVGARAFCEGVLAAVRHLRDADAGEYLGPGAAHVVKVADLYGLGGHEVAFVAAVAVFEGRECSIARVGDVSAFALTATGFQELFQEPDGHVNVVHDVLPADPMPDPETSRAGDLDRVVLCTDGLANDLRTSHAVQSWLAESWAEPPDVSRMAEALRYRRRGSHDDRTAVLVSTPPVPECDPEDARSPAATDDEA
jgi:hypothetical protein